MGITAPDPTQMMPGQGAAGGQSGPLLQQVQQLLAQVMQNESDPGIQRAVNSMMQLLDPLMQAVGSNDQGDMSSGLNNPTGLGPPDMGGDTSGGGDSKSFSGARKAAMANFGQKGHFSKSGSKGEKLQTEKTKTRKAKAG